MNPADKLDALAREMRDWCRRDGAGAEQYVSEWAASIAGIAAELSTAEPQPVNLPDARALWSFMRAAMTQAVAIHHDHESAGYEAYITRLEEAAHERVEDLAVMLYTAPPAQPACMARDAERYRWLRSRDLDTIHRGGVFAGLTPDNLVLNGEDLDIAIDNALLKASNS